MMYFHATKGEEYFNTSKSDLVCSLRVNQIRVIALNLFVTKMLNYMKQLQAHMPETTAQPPPVSAQKSSDQLNETSQVSLFSLCMHIYIIIYCNPPPHIPLIQVSFACVSQLICHC